MITLQDRQIQTSGSTTQLFNISLITLYQGVAQFSFSEIEISKSLLSIKSHAIGVDGLR